MASRASVGNGRSRSPRHVQALSTRDPTACVSLNRLYKKRKWTRLNTWLALPGNAVHSFVVISVCGPNHRRVKYISTDQRGSTDFIVSPERHFLLPSHITVLYTSLLNDRFMIEPTISWAQAPCLWATISRHYSLTSIDLKTTSVWEHYTHEDDTTR